LVLALLAGGAFVMFGQGDESADTLTGAPAATDAAASESVPAATVAPTTQAPATTAPETTAPPATDAPTTTAAAVAAPSYPTLPDGSPEPIVAIFDGSTVRVTGWVPNQAKADQLIALAKANSTDPNAVVDAQLQFDPAVPLNIGTRVIEMNSPRFASGSAEVGFDHAVQLDRVAGVLNLLPNVTVTVVGHADQIGDEAANYALSEARAVAVVRYLVSKGVAPNRLSARAMGEQDLLTVDESEAALELNRRTEFIFYGLIAD
jgi:outer membrane protein OmpA-like peptidoglycan-associated protein